MLDGKQQTPRAAPEEVRTAGAAGSPRWAARLADRARSLGAADVPRRRVQATEGGQPFRPCAPQYALRDSASVANSSAVWAQPPRDASAPAFSPVPPGSRSAHFLCVAGRLEVCLEGMTGARRQPDGAEQLALGPRVGSGAAGGLRTPAPRVRSTLLPRPSCSPLHGVCAASEGPRRVPVHYRQRTRFCLCVRRSSPYVVAVRARITRRLAPVCLPAPVYAAQL